MVEPVPPVDVLLGDYDRFLRRRGRALSTRLQYSYPLQCFATWMEDGPVGELTAGDLERFLSWWEEQFEARRGRPPRRATVRGTIGALRGFFDYLERTGSLVTAGGARIDNPMDQVFSPTHEQRPNDFLRPTEDAALLSCPCSDFEKTIVWLLRWTGLRVSEARAVTLEDIDLTPDSESLLIRTSKTSAGRRTVPIVPQLIPVIERRMWLLERAQMASPQTPLLATTHGTAMTSTYIWRVVKRVSERASIRVVHCTCASRRVTLHTPGCPRTVSGENRSRVSPHTLRRTFGSDLLNRGLRLEVVSRLLGHANTTITERAYAHLLGDTVRTELLRVLTNDRQ
jgi:integrase